MKMILEILRNLVNKRATRNYPLVKRNPFSGVRGELVNDISKCIFCKVCQVKCPSNCIEVDKEARIWKYDPMECVYCGICSENCPKKCLTHKSEYRSPVMKRETVIMHGLPIKGTGEETSK